MPQIEIEVSMNLINPVNKADGSISCVASSPLHGDFGIVIDEMSPDYEKLNANRYVLGSKQKIPITYRDAKTNADGTIDCIISHQKLGDIPFTASPNDCEDHGRKIHAAISAVL